MNDSGLPLSAFARARLKVKENAEVGANRIEVDHNVSSEDDEGECIDYSHAEQDVLDYEPLSDAGEVEDVDGDPLAGKIKALTSTWRPRGQKNSSRSDQGWLIITLAAGEDVTFIGQYEFRVMSGIVAVGGAFFTTSSRGYKVFAPSTHSLPVIQASPENGASVEIRPSRRSLCRLLQLSPLFQKIWNHPRWPQSAEMKDCSSQGFSYVASSRDDPLKRVLMPLELDAAWASALSTLSKMTAMLKRHVMLVCGAQGTGKSTFCRFLLNRLLGGPPQGSKNDSASSRSTVCYLDLDPGQSEFTPSAQVSLVQIMEPLLGPPYSHCCPVASSSTRILRAHSVCSTSANEDIHHFIACAIDLYQYYTQLSKKCSVGPLIINTPGSILGAGLEALLQILPVARPDHIVFILPRPNISQNRAEVEESQLAIKDAIAEFGGEVVSLLAHRSSGKSRTSAQLRDMQSMSYFHSTVNPRGQVAWDASPISADGQNLITLRFRHSESTVGVGSGEEKELASIIGVASMGQEPPPGQLATVIDNNILAAVYIEDIETLASISSSLEDAQSPSPKIPHLSAQLTSQLLQPSKSQLLGLVFVREITETAFKVRSPCAPFLLQSCASGRVILVRRDVPAPGWAYKELAHLARRWRTKDRTGEKAGRKSADKPQQTQWAHSGVTGSGEDEDQEMYVRGIKWVSLGRKRSIVPTSAGMSTNQLAQDLGSKRWRGMPRGL